MANYGRTVVELNNDGKIIKRWASVRQCSIECGLHHYLVAYYCKTGNTMKNGRIFRYEGEERTIPGIPDYPCGTCRRFSRNGRSPSGYCLRLRRNVLIIDTCGEHEYPKNGKFIK